MYDLLHSLAGFAFSTQIRLVVPDVTDSWINLPRLHSFRITCTPMNIYGDVVIAEMTEAYDEVVEVARNGTERWLTW